MWSSKASSRQWSVVHTINLYIGMMNDDWELWVAETYMIASWCHKANWTKHFIEYEEAT